MARKPLQLHPQQHRPAARADFREGGFRRRVDRLDVPAVKHAPLFRVEDAQCARRSLSRRRADAKAVVLDEEQHRQLPLLRKAHRLVEIALPRRCIAHRGDDEALFPVELHAPRHAAGGQQLRRRRRGHAPDVQLAVAVVGRHLPAAGRRFALRHVVEGQLLRRHPPAEHQPAVAVVRNNVIVGLQLQARRRERLMAAAGHMKVPLALAVEVFLAQVAVTAFQNRRQQPAFERGGKAGSDSRHGTPRGSQVEVS